MRNATEQLTPATEATPSRKPARRRTGAVAALLATTLAGGLMAFAPVASAAPGAADSVSARPGDRLSDREADRILDRAGVRRVSPGDCHNVNRSRCTSYQGIQEDTVRGLVKLKRDSRCQVVVVNGTEVGNDRDRRSRYSHAGGHKVDLRENRCLVNHIRRTADRVRGTHDVVYRDNERGRPYVQYELERRVLDVTYF
ncbi:hypothetical protein [Streptomyces sp. UH6]|uniref:hypothetical protein n=1 Tax=Streptomyces sp. UH6 TaxID=2748379 RepID=UPI0015D4D214|nr:hypothetical protein [Streptomyces sp. UH6]NYV76853.1 hypothetical protein [Streptomyces sp. UH6]